MKDNDKGFKKIIENIEKYSRLEAKIGIVDPNIAEYAFYNEEGTADIPKRSFLASTFDDNKGWSGNIEYVRKLVLTGEEPIHAFSKFVCEIAVKDIKEKISSNIQPPNAESTVMRKTKGKGGKTTTLIDTGDMRNAVTFEISLK